MSRASDRFGVFGPVLKYISNINLGKYGKWSAIKDVSQDLIELAMASVNRLYDDEFKKVAFGNFRSDVLDRTHKSEDHERDNCVVISIPFVELVLGFSDSVMPDQISDHQPALHANAQQPALALRPAIAGLLEVCPTTPCA